MNRSLMTALIAWFMVSSFYAYQYIFRILPGLIVPELMDTFHVESNAIGNLGIYYLAYGLIHIPLGLLVDRFSAKKVIPICIILCILGNIPLVIGDSWSMTVWGRILVGIGSSGAPIGMFKIISSHFDRKMFSTMLGLAIAVGLSGAIFGTEPLNKVFAIYGWREVLKVVMIAGLGLALLMFIALPKDKDEEENKKHTIWEDLKLVVTSRKVILLGLFGGLMVGPLEGFADLWGKEFLQVMYTFEANTAARIPGLIFLGMLAGCTFIGYIGRKTEAYYGIVITAAVTMSGLFIYILSGHCPCHLIYLLFTVVGIMSAYQVIIVYLATTYMPVRLAGLTSAVTNSFIMGIGSIFHKVIGEMMFIFSEKMNDNITYPKEAFIKALAVIPMGLLIAAIGLLILKFYDRKSEDFIIHGADK